MGSIIKKIFTYLILPLTIAGLVYLLVSSIQQPVNFNKHKEYREGIAVQRLKDIRDLQVAYKNVNGRYVSTIDSLKKFYNEGKIQVVMQIGSKDDSLAMANTKKAIAKLRKFKGEQRNQELKKLYDAGDKNLVFSVNSTVFVKDTLSLKEGCVLNGNLHIRRLAVELGATFNGTCSTITEAEFNKIAGNEPQPAQKQPQQQARAN